MQNDVNWLSNSTLKKYIVQTSNENRAKPHHASSHDTEDLAELKYQLGVHDKQINVLQRQLAKAYKTIEQLTAQNRLLQEERRAWWRRIFKSWV